MSLRLLLVDEWDDARRALEKRLLRTRGVTRVNAISTLSELTPHVANEPHDATLLDLHRHHLRGPDIALCRDLTAAVAAPLFLLTSFMAASDWENLRRAGAAGFLLKRIDTEQLVRDLAALTASALAQTFDE